MSGGPLRFLRAVLPPLLLFACVLLVWQWAVWYFDWKPFFVPGPKLVWEAAVENRVALGKAMLLTGTGALAGFALSFAVGAAIALLFSQSRIAERALYPYAIFLQTVPIVAVAPLIVVWFGPGFQGVVAVAFIVSLFPIVTGGTAGLTSVPRGLVELFEANRATRMQTLFKLRVPHSVPYFVTAAKTSAGLSVIGAIVGEFFAGYGSERYSLGYLITVTSGQLKTSYLFACVMASALLGLAIFLAVGAIGRLATARWQDTK